MVSSHGPVDGRCLLFCKVGRGRFEKQAHQAGPHFKKLSEHTEYYQCVAAGLINVKRPRFHYQYVTCMKAGRSLCCLEQCVE
jgi:hypothetical protein